MRMDRLRRRLLWHGMLLFLLGLASGLVEQKLRNPRMGLAAHLEGLMNGTLLLALGAAWQEVRLPPRAAAVAFGATLYGAYANWIATTFAAMFGTAAMTPLASGVFRGQRWQEIFVAAGFVSVALAMLVSATLLLWGFRADSTRDGAYATAIPPDRAAH